MSDQERMKHDFSMRGIYKDEAPMGDVAFYNKDWWTSQRFCNYDHILILLVLKRFFWERSLSDVPHTVVFVFDGSSEPFLDQESLSFFKTIFEDCTKYGKNYNDVIITNITIINRL